MHYFRVEKVTLVTRLVVRRFNGSLQEDYQYYDSAG